MTGKLSPVFPCIGPLKADTKICRRIMYEATPVYNTVENDKVISKIGAVEKLIPNLFNLQQVNRVLYSFNHQTFLRNSDNSDQLEIQEVQL